MKNLIMDIALENTTECLNQAIREYGAGDRRVIRYRAELEFLNDKVAEDETPMCEICGLEIDTAGTHCPCMGHKKIQDEVAAREQAQETN